MPTAPTSTNKNMDERIQAIIREIAEKSAGGGYLYRGEPEYYTTISSSLYRAYNEPDSSPVTIEDIQQKMLEEAGRYTDETDEEAILTQLQHYGGATNLIDFTTDCLIALFFACDGGVDKDGRVILLREEEHRIITPRTPVRRVLAQKSRFVRPHRGVIEPEEAIVIDVPQDLKETLLAYLRQHHGISIETVYNDLHGYIRYQKHHESAYRAFYDGLTCHEEKEYQASIKYYNKAIEMNPEHAGSRFNRGLAYYHMEDLESAIKDFSRAIELEPEDAESWNNRGNTYFKKGDLNHALSDYNQAIKLNLKHVGARCNRVLCRLCLSDWAGVRSDLTVDVELRMEVAEIFQKVHESVDEFERKTGLQLPEDLAGMLTPPGDETR